MKRADRGYILLFCCAIWSVQWSYAISVGLTAQATGIAVQTDGKYVVSGIVNDNDEINNFGVIRYKTGGTLDTGFNSNGIVTKLIGTRAEARGVAIQSTDQFIVAGGFAIESGIAKFALVRYDTNGAVDLGFDGDGTVTTVIGDGAGIEGIAIQVDGKIVVAGVAAVNGQPQIALARYNPNGSLDTSGFNAGGVQPGVVTTAVGVRSKAFDVAIQSDGKIVVAGVSEQKFVVVRYNPDGSPDNLFGTDGNGIVTTSIGDMGEGRSVAFDGTKIIVAGWAQLNGKQKVAVARYTSIGELDALFDIPEVGNRAQAFDVAVQLDGKVVVVGFSDDEALCMRYEADGTLDTSFAQNGIFRKLFASSAQLYSVVLQPSDQKIVTVGATAKGIIFLRLNSDGSIDETLGIDGQPEGVSGSTINLVPILIWEEYSAGTNAGTFNKDIWQMRDLNKFLGDSGLVSLSGNQFTLAPGRHQLILSAPAYRVGLHQIRLFNVTDNKPEKYGTSAVSKDNNKGSMTRSFIRHVLFLTEAKTFQIEHQCNDFKRDEGLGIATGFGSPEIYTQMEIVPF